MSYVFFKCKPVYEYTQFAAQYIECTSRMVFENPVKDYKLEVALLKDKYAYTTSGQWSAYHPAGQALYVLLGQLAFLHSGLFSTSVIVFNFAATPIYWAFTWPEENPMLAAVAELDLRLFIKLTSFYLQYLAKAKRCNHLLTEDEYREAVKSLIIQPLKDLSEDSEIAFTKDYELFINSYITFVKSLKLKEIKELATEEFCTVDTLDSLLILLDEI